MAFSLHAQLSGTLLNSNIYENFSYKPGSLLDGFLNTPMAPLNMMVSLPSLQIAAIARKRLLLSAALFVCSPSSHVVKSMRKLPVK